MRSRHRVWLALFSPLLFAACPTRTVYYDAGAEGSAGQGGGAGGQGGGAGGDGGHAGAGPGGSAGGLVAPGGTAGGSASGGSAGGVSGHPGQVACDATSCSDGCCTAAGVCVSYAKQTEAACGNTGAICSPCVPGVACNTSAGLCLGCGPGTAISRMTAGFPSVSNEQFGSAIALRDGSLLVAAPSNPTDVGNVLAFSGVGASFPYLEILAPTPGTATSAYAQGLGMDGMGTMAIVEGSIGGTPTDWIFTKSGGSWFMTSSFAPGQAGNVAIDTGTVVIGAADGAYLYSASGSATQVLTAPDFTPGAETGQFGAPVAISGDTMWVTGQPEDSSFALGHFGYIFVKVGSTWTQQAKLIPSDLAANSSPHFQFSVALDGGTAVLATTLGAYVFARSGTTWSQVQKINVPANAPGFGSAVALSGDTLVVSGSSYAGTPGAAYVYGRSNGSWIPGPTLSSGALDANTDGFGVAAAVSGGTVAVAAPFSSSGGAVYLFSCQPDR